MAEVGKLRSEGLSLNEIAVMLKISKTSVLRLMRKVGDFVN